MDCPPLFAARRIAVRNHPASVARGPPCAVGRPGPDYDARDGEGNMTPTASPAQDVLVATKLYVPDVRPGILPRGELVARLAGGEGRRLVLVCAPAGWGKTILLGTWHASEQETRPFAWVSLDPSDDDPVRFWRYVIAALQTVHPGV